MLEVIALASLAVTTLSAGYAAYSSYQQGKAVQKQSQYNAEVATVNQRTTQKQADSAVSDVREKYRRIRGSQRAAAAASGLQTDGSLSDLFLDTNVQEDMEVLKTLYQAKLQISDQEHRKNSSLMQGDQAMSGARLAAAGSLLSGVGDALGSYHTLKTSAPSTIPKAYPTIAG